MTTDSYYKTRYSWDKNRSVVWQEVTRYLSKYVPKDGSVLDLGAGYCDFINNIEAKNKIALDISADFRKFASSDVFTIQSDVSGLSSINSDSLDVVFASNFLEHFSDEELSKIIIEIKRILKTGGKLILIQPNYSLSYKKYFDDPTHKKVFSHESLKNFLMSHGFDILSLKSRFLPFSFKSKPSFLPVNGFLVRLYLLSPFKPFAGQMLCVSTLKK